MVNNIQALLNKLGISIKQMSKDLGLDYSVAHRLATRDSLETIALGRVAKIADYLNVNIETLYEEGLSMMYKLVLSDEGDVEVLKVGTIQELKSYLQDNYDDLFDWINSSPWRDDGSPAIDLPDLSNVEDYRDLDYELEKVNLSWWKIELEELEARC